MILFILIECYVLCLYVSMAPLRSMGPKRFMNPVRSMAQPLLVLLMLYVEFVCCTILSLWKMMLFMSSCLYIFTLYLVIARLVSNWLLLSVALRYCINHCSYSSSLVYVTVLKRLHVFMCLVGTLFCKSLSCKCTHLCSAGRNEDITPVFVHIVRIERM